MQPYILAHCSRCDTPAQIDKFCWLIGCDFSVTLHNGDKIARHCETSIDCLI